MVRITDDFRLIIKLISGIILALLILGTALLAAIMVGWAMALGMSIVFVLEFVKRWQHNH